MLLLQLKWLGNHKALLILLLLFSFTARVWNLEHPNSFYFDEVYHAYTAEAYSRNDPAGYEWWHDSPAEIPYCTAPKCAAYEWLHPPLAKLIQAGSIKMLGDQPFAWRYPGVLFGTGIIILLYLFGVKIFNSSRLGLVAALIYALDGLAFTSSRITMNDTYLAFWVVLSLYLFLIKKPLWLVGLVLGLAIATKWPGVFVIGIIGILWIVRELGDFRGIGDFARKIAGAFLAFLVLPLFVYIASYGQFWLQDHTLEQFGELHQQIWWYQTNLKAEHPYSSRPHEWVLSLRPLYAYSQGMNDGKDVQNIYLMGNPFVFWGGLLAVVYALWYLCKSKLSQVRSKHHFFLFAVLTTYLVIFTPWFFSPRIMFIYHYVPAVPFLALLLAWLLNSLWQRQRFLVTCYLLLITFAFFYFYPHWTGITVPGWWDQQYYWLPSWR